jgi:hypothetical protein
METRQGLIDMIPNDIMFIDLKHVVRIIPGRVIRVEVATDYKRKTGVGGTRN